MGSRTERIETIFNALNRDSMAILDGFYHPHVVFEDPICRIEGLSKLKRYYCAMYDSVQAIHFDFVEHFIAGETHVAVWTMHMRAKRFNKGHEVLVEGISVIQFDERDLVTYHRDYFDVGAMVYEQVPVVRFFVRQVKKRLEQF